MPCATALVRLDSGVEQHVSDRDRVKAREGIQLQFVLFENILT